VFSRLTLGALSDRIPPWLLASITLSVTSLATFILWGIVGHVLSGVLVFGILFGLFTGGWSSMWSAFVRPVASKAHLSFKRIDNPINFPEDDIALYVSLFGHLMFSRGLANILSTPISNALSGHGSLVPLRKIVGLGFDVADGRFRDMIIFVGSCFAGCAAIAFATWGREMKIERRLWSNSLPI
jgi:MFS transporter, MCT family, solute carrier family 16 (monocarboxylic acid transporters), member 10